MSIPARNSATVERMAAAMQNISAAGRTVDDEALANDGFTLEQIAAFARPARDIANTRAVRQVA